MSGEVSRPVREWREVEWNGRLHVIDPMDAARTLCGLIRAQSVGLFRPALNVGQWPGMFPYCPDCARGLLELTTND